MERNRAIAAVRAERELDRANLRVHRNLGATMPWPLYEEQNRRARESYHRRRYLHDDD